MSLICVVTFRWTSPSPTSNATSLEKRNHMKALGADLTIWHSEGGVVSNVLSRALVATTEPMVRETGSEPPSLRPALSRNRS